MKYIIIYHFVMAKLLAPVIPWTYKGDQGNHFFRGKQSIWLRTILVTRLYWDRCSLLTLLVFRLLFSSRASWAVADFQVLCLQASAASTFSGIAS